ncbi:MAG: hypothetical protein KatS3mg102_1922 [Planctomycetota bacterium]|nr:MAG: hypothetical protein KatS3mg102_1922 [Planctomycetota bacterium]
MAHGADAPGEHQPAPAGGRALAQLSCAASPVPLLWIDRQGAIRDANAAAVTGLGGRAEAPLPRRLAELVGEPAAGMLLAALRQGRPTVLVAELPPAGAEQLGRPACLALSPLCGSAEPEGGALLAVLPPPEFAPGQLQRLQHMHWLATVGRFAGALTHELNNPLTSILGLVELLGLGLGEQEQREYRERLGQEAERAAELSRRLQRLARRESVPGALCDLNEAIQELLCVRGHVHRVQGIRVQCELAAELPPVRGDALGLVQLLANLVLNAEEALVRQGGGTLGLATEITADGAEVVLRVTDDGGGIPQAVRASLFAPFTSTGAAAAGCGLGLYLARAIVEQHGGRIDVEPHEPRGTAVVVRLPACRDRAPRRAHGAGAGAQAEAAPLDERRAGSAPHQARARVLVVDDERAVREFVAEALRRADYEVVGCDGAEAALERLAAERFAALVCDVHLGGAGGAALYEALRERFPAMAGRVLFVTGDTLDPRTRVLLARSGAPYLAKPFGVLELIQAVERVLEHAGASR